MKLHEKIWFEFDPILANNGVRFLITLTNSWSYTIISNNLFSNQTLRRTPARKAVSQWLIKYCIY